MFKLFKSSQSVCNMLLVEIYYCIRRLMGILGEGRRHNKRDKKAKNKRDNSNKV